MTIEEAADASDGSPRGVAPAMAPPPIAPRLGAARAWLIFFAYVGVQLAVGFFVGIAMAIAYGVTNPHAGATAMPRELIRASTIAGGVLGMVLAAAAALWLTWRSARREPGLLRALGWSGATVRMRLAASLAGIVLAVTFLAVLAIHPVPKGYHPGMIGDALKMGGWVVYVWIVLAIAIAPPVEEFVFRGVLWTGVSRVWGPIASAVAVTLVFVALHIPEAWGYAPSLLAIGALGLAALALRVHTRSLVPPIFLHAAYNGTLVLAALAGLMQQQ